MLSNRFTKFELNPMLHLAQMYIKYLYPSVLMYKNNFLKSYKKISNILCKNLYELCDSDL